MSCGEKLLLERYHEDRLNVRELRGRGGEFVYAWFAFTCRKNRGRLLLANVIEPILYTFAKAIQCLPTLALFTYSFVSTRRRNSPRFSRQMRVRLKGNQLLNRICLKNGVH